MRSLPLSVPVPQRIRTLTPELDRVQDAQAPAFRAVSQLVLTQVIRIRTTGAVQSVDCNVPVGTWFAARPSDYVRVKEISTNGTVVTLQADTAGVDLDLVVLY